MEQYRVRMTDHAIGQMGETVRYISKVLQAPETALRWTDRLEAEMAGCLAAIH